MRSYGALAAAAALMMSTAAVLAEEEPVPDEATVGYGVYEYLDWAGIYAGVQGGWLWGEDEAFESVTLTGVLTDDPLPYDTESYVIGGLVGINMQVGHWVYGGELDVEYTNISGRWDWDNGNGLTKDIDILGSLRLRAGFAADRFFVYGTGGVAVGNVKMVAFDADALPPLDAIEGEEQEFGWTAGGGFEVELWGNWSAGAEYRYTDLGRSDHNGEIFPIPETGRVVDRTYEHTNRFHTVRARLVYRMHI